MDTLHFLYCTLFNRRHFCPHKESEEKTHSGSYHINITTLLPFVCFSLLLVIIPPPAIEPSCPPEGCSGPLPEGSLAEHLVFGKGQELPGNRSDKSSEGIERNPLYSNMTLYCLGYKRVLRCFAQQLPR